MESGEQLRDRLRALFKSQRLAVLATHSKGLPYTSLVAFAATDDLKHLLFATARETRKYANLVADARASMLVDNRSNEISDFSQAIAVTAVGKVEEIHDKERDPLSSVYLSKHPNLKSFLASPSTALLKMRVETYKIVTEFEMTSEYKPEN